MPSEQEGRDSRVCERLDPAAREVAGAEDGEREHADGGGGMTHDDVDFIMFICVAVGAFAIAMLLMVRRIHKVDHARSLSGTFRPRGDRLLVRRMSAPEPKPGEVVTPSSMQRALNEGIVVSVGPGKRNRVTGRIDTIELKPGDHVCFLDHAGYMVEVDGESLLCLVDEEVFGARAGVNSPV
jgi:chaperonin GroES